MTKINGGATIWARQTSGFSFVQLFEVII